MEAYSHIIVELEEDLEQLAMTSDHVLNTTRQAIRKCRLSLVKLRGMVLARDFPDQESEIRFFKEIKPSVSSKLIYHQAVFGMESMRLELDNRRQKRYLQREQKKILKYMNQNRGIVQYYRCGHSHLDEKYFLRNNESVPLEVEGILSLMDGDFFTWHDHTFSTIMANELLLEYMKNEMDKPDHPERIDVPKRSLRWTGSKIDAYELLYSIYLTGSVNYGKVTVIDLVRAFEWMFNVDLQAGIYKTQSELEKRSDPVQYLSQLMAVMRRRINHRLK
ncbi:RteC domain-containing protein [uncultured Sunxiuqinia sp.]|uniref:RteC domain-containing protein n=1 Tax=uncultured Sunxiuqinia sp. TaxID=1573825 RepID=UPI0030D75EBD|tara:strand:+ start:487 stop:1314 length:828 start_codon:yes stop_codon:yes gene_type:complete